MSLFLRPDEVTDLNGRWHGIRLNEEYYAFFLLSRDLAPLHTPSSYIGSYSTSAQREERISETEIQQRLAIFPSPAGMSLTKLSLAGNNF
jgi:hypothetical protein